MFGFCGRRLPGSGTTLRAAVAVLCVAVSTSANAADPPASAPLHGIAAFGTHPPTPKTLPEANPFAPIRPVGFLADDPADAYVQAAPFDPFAVSARAGSAVVPVGHAVPASAKRTSSASIAQPIAPDPYDASIFPSNASLANPFAVDPYAVQRPVAGGYADEPPPIRPKRVVSYWVNEVLPEEILFRSYLGDPKGARMASRILHETNAGWMWELEAGGRIPLFRFGTPSDTVGRSGRPEGWQVDIEGAAFPRLNFEQELDLDYTDFRVGLPVTYQRGNWQYKIEFYHLSSHVGDELLIRDPTFQRVNYLRDAIRLSAGYFVNPDVRLYGEAEWAWNAHGGAEPWHFQFGFDYSPTQPSIDLRQPQPFFAANVGLREDVNFGGGVNIVTGLQWRGANSDHLFRFGVEYYNGKSYQYEIFDEHEELLGIGFWFDF